MGLQNEKIAALSFVTANLNYLAPAPDRPRTYTFDPPFGEPRSNIVPEPHSLPIHDVRPISQAVSLDREGFALVRKKSSVKDFYDEDEVKNVYYSEAERLIKAATGADRVLVFDHTVRKRVQGAADRGPAGRRNRPCRAGLCAGRPPGLSCPDGEAEPRTGTEARRHVRPLDLRRRHPHEPRQAGFACHAICVW